VDQYDTINIQAAYDLQTARDQLIIAYYAETTGRQEYSTALAIEHIKAAAALLGLTFVKASKAEAA
jgi:hypothetical protein